MVVFCHLTINRHINRVLGLHVAGMAHAHGASNPFSVLGSVFAAIHLHSHRFFAYLRISRYSPSMKSLGNKFMHLTNYSVNKKNTEYQTNEDETACQGHKWYSGRVLVPWGLRGRGGN